METLHDCCLERVSGVGRVYALESVGTLDVQSWRWRSATAHADGRDWQMVRHGFWKLRWVFEATDMAGLVVGSYEPRGRWRDRGVVCWAGRQLMLRPTSSISDMYVLAAGPQQLATIEHTGFRRPAVSVKYPAALESGLLLFVVFVVARMLADGTG